MKECWVEPITNVSRSKIVEKGITFGESCVSYNSLMTMGCVTIALIIFGVAIYLDRNKENAK